MSKEFAGLPKEAGKYEQSLVRIEKREAIQRAMEVCDKYQLSDKFGLVGLQTTLLVTNLARYFVLHKGGEVAYLANRPETEIIAGMKVFGFLAKAIFTRQRSFDRAAEELQQDINLVAKEYKKITISVALVSITKDSEDPLDMGMAEKILDLPEDYPGVREFRSKYDPFFDKVLRAYGTPEAIQRSANLISATIDNNSKLPKNELDKKLSWVIQNIKIKEVVS